MADVDFPEALRCCMLSGTLKEGGTDPWVSDRGEVGAPDRRKRFTRALRNFSYSMRLTSEQKAALEAFYDDDLDDGVQAFNWTHPWSGIVYEVQFSGRPEINHLYNSKWATQVVLEQI